MSEPVEKKLKTIGGAVLNAESTSLRISLVSSPTEDLVMYPGPVPDSARRLIVTGEGVEVFLDPEGRIVQYQIAKGTRPGNFVLEKRAAVLVRDS